MEEKRKLPSWMVRKPVKDEEEEESSVIVNEIPKPKVKRVTRKKDETVSSDGSNFLVKCGTKRKSEKSRDDVEEVGGVEKRKRGRGVVKVEESDVSRKKNGKDLVIDSGNENENEDVLSEEDDLTIEDMLIIAKEFVENDKREKGQQRPSEVLSESKNKSSHTHSSMTMTPSIATQDTRSRIIEQPASDHDLIEKTSEVTLGDIRMTDDPAQDMLDLFLGPLLKKPIGKEETVSIKDVVIPHEPKSQQREAVKEEIVSIKDVMLPRERKSQQREAVVSNKPVNFAKKKSSLRDAVAMLLES